MKIAIFIPDFRGGGAQHMMVNLANALAARGHNMTLLVAHNAGPFAEKVGKKVTVIDFQKTRTLMALSGLWNYVRKDQPDILLSALTHANIVALLVKALSKRTKTKFVISERNFFSQSLHHSKSKKDKFFALLVPVLYPLADKIIGVCKNVADDIKKAARLSENKVTWIHNPVIVDEINSHTKENTNIAELGRPGLPLIMTAGRLVPQKDHMTLLRAFAKMLQEKDARLLILGQGPLRPKLEALAQKLGIANKITFQGYVNNPLPYFKEAKLFVLSSAWEGFPNVMIEAMYCGLAIVSTDCPGGPAEILEDGKYGLLCPVGDDDALAAAMLKALEEKPDPEIQKKRALDFTASKIAAQYEAVFQEILT